MDVVTYPENGYVDLAINHCTNGLWEAKLKKKKEQIINMDIQKRKRILL